MSDLKEYMGVVLCDDETECGGTAFQGETVRDFMESLDLDNASQISTLEDLNTALMLCGIKPISANAANDGRKK